MSQRLLPVAVVVAAMLGLAPAAHAKGPTEAIVEGPGLDRPARVQLADPVPGRPDLQALLGATGGEQLIFNSDARMAVGPPSGDLGDRYLITFMMGDQVALRQEVYPFAEQGPVSYTPDGQPHLFLGGGTIQSGWLEATGALREQLALLGVPRAAAAAANMEETGADPAVAVGSGSDTGTWMAALALASLVVVVVVVVLVGGSMLVRRRLTSAGPPAER